MKMSDFAGSFEVLNTAKGEQKIIGIFFSSNELLF